MSHPLRDLAEPLLHQTEDIIEEDDAHHQTPERLKSSSFFIESSDNVSRDGGTMKRSAVQAISPDRFLNMIYGYHQGRGFWPLILNRLFYLSQFAVLLLLLTLVLNFIDWDTLRSDLKDNHPEKLPLQLSWYIVISFSRIHSLWWFVLVNAVIFWLFQALRYGLEIREFYFIRQFFHEVLHFRESEIRVIEWEQVIIRLKDTPGSPWYQIQTHHLINRIMRRDNFVIALVEDEVIPLKLAGWGDHSFMTSSFQWALELLIEWFFDTSRQQNTVSLCKEITNPMPSARARFARQLIRRFRWLGLLMWVSSPLIFLFAAMLALFPRGDQLKNQPSLLGLRSWTRLARWKLRHYNELPHLLAQRLSRARDPAEHYLRHFQYFHLGPVIRFVSFVAGSVLTCLFLLTVWNEDVLFNLEIFPRQSTLWLMGMLGSILAVLRGLAPDPQDEDDSPRHAEETLHQVTAETRYHPTHWNRQAHTSKVHAEFSDLFGLRIQQFALDLLSLLILPFILVFYLPSHLDRLMTFFAQESILVPDLGHICRRASFDRHQPDLSHFPYREEEEDLEQSSPMSKIQMSLIHFQEIYGPLESAPNMKHSSNVEEEGQSYSPPPIPTLTAEEEEEYMQRLMRMADEYAHGEGDDLSSSQ